MNSNTNNSTCIVEMENVKMYSCSKCHRPNTPTKCVHCGNIENASGGGDVIKQIPKLSGRYFTNYLDYERSEWDIEQKGEGRLYRASYIKEKMISFIYSGEDYRVVQLFNSLEKVYSYFREQQYHNAECEFAVGNSCWCWCGEKYHGLKGVGAEKREQR